MKVMKSTGRVISVLLVFLMAFGILAGCSGKTPQEGAETPPETVTRDDGPADSVLSDEERYAPSQKYYDTDYVMATSNPEMWGIRHYTARDGDADTLDTINYALWLRQVLMEEQYGVTLRLNQQSNLYNAMSTTVSSGTFFADAVYLSGVESMRAAASGLLCDLASLSPLNLSACYWNQRIQTEYRIGDKLFALDGDFDMTDNMVTFSVLVNRNVYENIEGLADHYGDIYDMVWAGDWTYEVMLEMASLVTDDSNGDGTMDQNDTWGIVSERQAPYYFYLGSGVHAFTNVDGSLVFDSGNATFMTRLKGILSNTLQMGVNPNVLIAERDIKTGETFQVASDIFTENRALFRSTSLSAVVSRGLSSVQGLRYSMLPIPKYYGEQDAYYNWVSTANHHPLCIPITVADRTVVAEISEILTYHSRYGADTLYQAFYDKLRYMKMCQTEEDLQMLEMIYSNKTYDIENATSILDIWSLVMVLTLSGDPSTFTSDFDARVEAAKTKIVEFVSNVQNNYRE